MAHAPPLRPARTVLCFPGPAARAPQKLREELHEIALAKCDSVIREFVDCSKEAGILVVFKCREQNKGMNACLTSFKNAEAFERYRNIRENELVSEGAAPVPAGPLA